MPMITVQVNIATSSNATIVSATANSPIAVRKVTLTADADTTITFQDTAGKAYAGPFTIKANGSFFWGEEGSEQFRTDNGTGLVIAQTGAANIGGIVAYLRG